MKIKLNNSFYKQNILKFKKIYELLDCKIRYIKAPENDNVIITCVISRIPLKVETLNFNRKIQLKKLKMCII